MVSRGINHLSRRDRVSLVRCKWERVRRRTKEREFTDPVRPSSRCNPGWGRCGQVSPEPGVTGAGDRSVRAVGADTWTGVILTNRGWWRLRWGPKKSDPRVAVTRNRGTSPAQALVPSKVMVSSSRWECSAATAVLPSASPVDPPPVAASSFISTTWGPGGGGGSCSPPPGGGFALSAPRRRAEPSCFMAPRVAA